MANALAEFFPDEDTGKPLSALSPRVSDRPIPLRRVNTGVSSIVGADNGDRPGGFVLVLDGAALLEVRITIVICDFDVLIILGSGFRR